MDCELAEISGLEAAAFDEDQWLRILFWLSDIQSWINGQKKQLLDLVPITDGQKINKRNSLLSVISLAHILERHYHKVQRHPEAGKFTIPLVRLLMLIKDCSQLPACRSPKSGLMVKSKDLDFEVGFDKSGKLTSQITLLCDREGNIVTAFPGKL